MENNYASLVYGSAIDSHAYTTGALPFLFRHIFQRLGVSNKNICILGVVLGICGSVIIADWQSVRGDPCDQYSYERLKTVAANLTSSDSCGGIGSETFPGVLQYVTIQPCTQIVEYPFCIN